MRDTPCCLFFWINYCIEAERKQVRFAGIMGSFNNNNNNKRFIPRQYPTVQRRLQEEEKKKKFKRTSQWKPFQ